MKFVTYLNINSEIIYREKEITSMLITRNDLLSDFGSYIAENFYCWIFCKDQQVWIKSSNDASFSQLISALSYENKSDKIEVIFNDTGESPNISKRNSFDMSSVINIEEPFSLDEIIIYDKNDL